MYIKVLLSAFLSVNNTLYEMENCDLRFYD